MDEIERLLAEWRNEAADHDNVHTVLAETLDRCADGLEAAMESLQVGWQPIESAPRDGTRILGWNKWDGVLVYEPYRYGSNGQFEGWRSPLDHEDTFDFPTHWQPLPSTPTQGEAA